MIYLAPILLIVLLYTNTNAQTLGVRPTHPIALQHQLPTGEAPGWLSNNWIDFETTHGNHWGEPTSYTDLRNDNNLVWDSDFEQTTLWLESGHAISKKIAFSLEAPFLVRHEGESSDQFIDEFHKTFKFSRFGRQRHDKGRVINETRVTPNGGSESVKRSKDSGIGSFKFKFKYWPIKWHGDTGIGFSFHTKFPLDDKKQGLSSGAFDYSALMHFAVPFGERSGVYLTGGGTYASKNYLFDEWPRNKILLLGDLHLILGVAEAWSVVFNTSMSTAFIDKDKIAYEENLATEPGQENVVQRGSSNYNSLALTRGYQLLGLKYYFGDDDINYWMIYIMEDWGLGDKDKTGDYLYSNNQPDIALGLKSVFYF